MAPNSGLMDEAALKQWILRRLGSPFLKVELTDDHLKDAVEYARRWFAAKKGIRGTHYMEVYAGRTEYELPDFIDTVEDMAFMTPKMDISLVFSPFTLLDDKVPYDVFAAPHSIGLYSSYTQTIQYVEMAKRILGAEPDWRQEGRILHIFPIPRNYSKVLLFFKGALIVIEQLNERDHDLVKRWAFAHAKEDLGRIRSKYGEFPTAQGTAQLDGERLLSEAAEMKEVLDEEIGLSGFPLGFMRG